MSYLVDSLCSEGILDSALRIPHTAGDLEVVADLRAQQLVAAVDVAAPQDRGAKARANWLVKQLAGAPNDLVIEAYPKNARVPRSAQIAAAREDRSVLLDDAKHEPHRFRLVMRADMGMLRKTGRKSASFIDTVLSLVESFYADVVQHLTPWQAPAPKLQRPAVVVDTNIEDSPSETAEFESHRTGVVS